MAARAVVVAPALCLIIVAAAGGGYYPTATAAVAVAALWAAGVALAIARPTLGRTDVALVGSFALLAVSVAVRNGGGTETIRVAAYLGVVAVAVLVAVELRAALTATTIGTASICAYALGTRLFPERLGRFDPVAGYRLSEPLQYWNALGIFATIGLLGAVGLALDRQGRARRVVAAAAVPTLALALYFTFSRGAWIALAAGIVCMIALARDRVNATIGAVVTGSWAALVIGVATQLDALTHVHVSIEQATREGALLSAVLCAATIGAAASILAVDALGRRVVVPGRAHNVLAVVVIATVVVGVGSSGLPRRALDGFHAPSPKVDDLNARLFSFSGSGRLLLWRTAWDEFASTPAVGTGPGTFEAHWLRGRESAIKVRDAHSLYLETLAELGIVGLSLLLAALLVPVYAAVKVRRHPLVPAALGAYVAYLVHAGIDWDWEMPAVTLSALFIGAAIVVARRDAGTSRLLGRRVRAGALAATVALLAVAFVGLVGNMALSESARAARAGDWTGSIEHAERARAWARWSPEPDRRIGDAELALGRPSRARASYERAIGKAPGDWNLWFDLARASTGGERLAALARARTLNPLSPEIQRFRSELAQAPIAVVRSEASP